jgi:hypothetical protein
MMTDLRTAANIGPPSNTNEMTGICVVLFAATSVFGTLKVIPLRRSLTTFATAPQVRRNKQCRQLVDFAILMDFA